MKNILPTCLVLMVTLLILEQHWSAGFRTGNHDSRSAPECSNPGDDTKA